MPDVGSVLFLVEHGGTRKGPLALPSCWTSVGGRLAGYRHGGGAAGPTTSRRVRPWPWKTGMARPMGTDAGCSRSPKNPALQQLQKSSESASAGSWKCDSGRGRRPRATGVTTAVVEVTDGLTMPEGGSAPGKSPAATGKAGLRGRRRCAATVPTPAGAGAGGDPVMVAAAPPFPPATYRGAGG